MTPKEKAEELFNKYYQYDITIIGIESQFEERGIGLYDAKQLALIAVDEILKSNSLEPQLQRHRINGVKPEKIHLEYWQQVKEEIQVL
jgi:tRNA A37 threonylcarbamoyltransferase TsaD